MCGKFGDFNKLIQINSINSITTFDQWINYIKIDVIDVEDITQNVIDGILYYAKSDLTKLGLKQLINYLESVRN